MRLSLLTLPLPEEEAEEAEELTEMIECGRLLLRLSDIIEPHTECRNFGADGEKKLQLSIKIFINQSFQSFFFYLWIVVHN